MLKILNGFFLNGFLMICAISIAGLTPTPAHAGTGANQVVVKFLVRMKTFSAMDQTKPAQRKAMEEFSRAVSDYTWSSTKEAVSENLVRMQNALKKLTRTAPPKLVKDSVSKFVKSTLPRASQVLMSEVDASANEAAAVTTAQEGASAAEAEGASFWEGVSQFIQDLAEVL